MRLGLHGTHKGVLSSPGERENGFVGHHDIVAIVLNQFADKSVGMMLMANLLGLVFGF